METVSLLAGGGCRCSSGGGRQPGVGAAGGGDDAEGRQGTVGSAAAEVKAKRYRRIRGPHPPCWQQNSGKALCR